MTEKQTARRKTLQKTENNCTQTYCCKSYVATQNTIKRLKHTKNMAFQNVPLRECLSRRRLPPRTPSPEGVEKLQDFRFASNLWRNNTWLPVCGAAL